MTYSDPHPGIDHPGEWIELVPGKRWMRFLSAEESAALGYGAVHYPPPPNTDPRLLQ